MLVGLKNSLLHRKYKGPNSKEISVWDRVIDGGMSLKNNIREERVEDYL